MKKTNLALSSLILLGSAIGAQADEAFSYSSLGSGAEIRGTVLADSSVAEAYPGKGGSGSCGGKNGSGSCGTKNGNGSCSGKAPSSSCGSKNGNGSCGSKPSSGSCGGKDGQGSCGSNKFRMKR